MSSIYHFCRCPLFAATAAAAAAAATAATAATAPAAPKMQELRTFLQKWQDV